MYLTVYLRLRRPAGSTLFPYTTLFRSGVGAAEAEGERRGYHPVDRESPVRHGGETGRCGEKPPRPVSPPCRTGDSRRSEEHTSELQSRQYLVCRLLLEKKTTGIHQRHR